MTHDKISAEHDVLGIEISLEYSDRMNYAMQQQGSPLVEAVLLTNTTDRAYEDGVVRLRLANGECEGWERQLARVAPGTTVRVVPDGWSIRPEKLRQRTEAERTGIDAAFTVEKSQVRRSFELDVLAFDQWAGVGHFPQYTGAFVTPNHSLIADLLGEAREILGNRGESDSLDGYQSGSKQRAARIAEACYLALASRGIGYINPPASFEQTGQRIRLVDRVLREKLGTCLDLSLVLMAMWEQCGLNTVLLLPEGHALPAFWTHGTHLPETAIDEPARIRNLIELGEMVPVESTLITKERHEFEAAVSKGREQMASPGGSFCAIDLKSARKRGIRPLPLTDETLSEQQRASGVGGSDEGATSELESVLLAERADRQVVGQSEPEDETADSRILRWQNRLLDLSLRNRLLNFKQSGRTLPLCAPDLAALEDMLAGDERFTVLSRSRETEGDDYYREELGSNRLYADAAAADTQKRLLTLYRLSRSGIEETGANLLHLALGHLVWYESESAETPRIAPLILLPVKLTRTSSGSGYSYKLALTDEPIRPNITLLEKLRNDYGINTEGLDDLPEDESGIDVPLVLRNFRSAIRDSNRWEVVESANLGLFSFNKFLMWRDLRENIDRLKENRLVHHLVETPGESFEDEPFPDPRVFDDELKPGELFCTRDADSSQLTAIRAAGQGRTFVLEGPPGTGKSQTIANMVADAVARGKRVLFVAEKMAALSVVRKRLNQDGLGPYCLELHSTKGSKKEVLAQLAEALNAPEVKRPRGWEQVCTELGSTRDKLNEYVRELHRVRPSGETLYEMLGRLTMLGQRDPVGLSFSDVASTTDQHLEVQRALVSELVERAQPVDPVSRNPLRGIGLASWDFGLNERAVGLIGSARQAAESLRSKLVPMLLAIAPDPDADSIGKADLQLLYRLAGLIDRCPVPAQELVDGPNAEPLRARLREFISLGRERDALRGGLLESYHEEVLGLDTLGHLDQIKRASAQIAPFRWLRGTMIRRKLRPYAKGVVPALDQLQSDLEKVRELAKLESEYATQSQGASALSESTGGVLPDWNTCEAMLNWCDEFDKAVVGCTAEGADSKLVAVVTSAVCDRNRVAAISAEAHPYLSAYDSWVDAYGVVESALCVYEYADDTATSSYLKTIHERLDRWQNGIDGLSAWCGWRRARDAAAAGGLGQLAEAYERGDLDCGSLSDAFEREFGVQWFNATANSISAIREFNADVHGGTIEKFRALDSGVIDRTKAVVASILGDAAPSAPKNASSRSEVGILRREMEKKRRHMPTRRLIASIPNLLPRLKPCFLMSPLSVAQFLDSEVPPFDLVVFDEASQIPVWDAIGAVARGKEVVVVGDSKQLPPTSFFNSLDGDDEFDADDHVVDDMESILKECTAAGIPSLRLKWHYRSRHESLIAFSNQLYYQNELHTFPSPAERSDRLGVTFRHVEDGVYDRGGTRTNRVEAERVVGDVVRLLQDPDDTNSIGIVTFNQAQQTLIEDLLDVQRRENPELEHHFASSAEEPVFVKNLENVQGDERDTIVFSVGYGKDSEGRVSMNFGPLNKEGGERRLNVAVTRAKRRLIVYSAMTSDEIDLRKTSVTGVKHFRMFLDYAARGTLAVSGGPDGSDRGPVQASFEDAVRAALEAKGWRVDTRVGYAGYRIDLAVRDPDKEGEYLLGIECDGAMYSGANTARDRDRTRSAVLTGLGWRLHRVWSVQWRINSQQCIDQIEASLASRMTAQDHDGSDVCAPESSISLEATESHVAETAEAGRIILSEYRAAPKPRGGAREVDIGDEKDRRLILEWLGRIVSTEQPITSELAVRRLSDWCGNQQLRGGFREGFAELLDVAIEAGELVERSGVLWESDETADLHHIVRSPSEKDDGQRELEEIPGSELTLAMLYVLQEQFGLPREDLLRETGKLFGVSRITARAAEILGPVIDRLIDEGRARESNGLVEPLVR